MQNNNKQTENTTGNSHYLLPAQLSDPFLLDRQTLCGISSEDSHCFMVTRLDGFLLYSTRLPQTCRIGDIYEDICLLIGTNSLFFSTDAGFSFTEIPLELEQDERLSQVKIYHREIIVQLSQMKSHPKFGLMPRLLRLSLSNKQLWQTRLPVVNELSFLISCPDRSSENLPQAKESKPRYWVASGHQPQISDHILMVSYGDYATSGLGAWYAVNIDNGELLWQSQSEPIADTLALSSGGFILSASGYGAFDSYLFTREKHISTHWPSSGACLETSQGKIISTQSTDTTEKSQQLVELAPDGSLTRLSPAFPDGKGYTSKVLQLSDDKLYFWRDNYLWRWQQGQAMTPLMAVNTACYLVKLLKLSATSFALIYAKEKDQPLNLHIFDT